MYARWQAKADSYTVTVTGGDGSGSFAENASVTIKANEPETGKVFAGWSGADNLTFTSGSASSAEAVFTMPARDVTLEATYADAEACVTVGSATTYYIQTIDVTKAATPNLAVTQPAYEGDTGSISSSSIHEYSIDENSWTDCTGYLTGLTANTY